MTRDETVVQMLGAGGDLPLPPEPASSVFSPYLTDAYRFVANEDTKRAFSCLHKLATLAHTQDAMNLAALLSSVSPRGASPWRYRTWYPVSFGDLLAPIPHGILGFKETISTEDDWRDDFSLNTTTGAVTGLPDDGKVYWVPLMWFPNENLHRLIALPLGLKKEWIPPTLDMAHYPALLALTERALQAGVTEKGLVSLAHAWAGGDFHLNSDTGQDEFDPDGAAQATLVEAGQAERAWEPPMEVDLLDLSKSIIQLVNVPPSTLIPLSVVRLRGVPEKGASVASFSHDYMVRSVRGKQVRVQGSLPSLNALHWTYMQMLNTDPSPPLSVELSVATDSSASEIERVTAVLSHLLAKMTTGTSKITLSVS